MRQEMMGFWDDGISWTVRKQSAPRSTPTPHHSVFTGRMLFLTPNRVKAMKTIYKLEGKYALESTDPRESETRAHLRP